MYEFQEGLEESNVGIFRAYRYGMLTTLILNDVVGAQLVWKRVLEQKKKPLEKVASSKGKGGKNEASGAQESNGDEVGNELSLLGKIWDLGKQLKLKDRKKFYALVESTEWPSEVQPFIAALRISVRERMTRFIATAYRSVPLDKCAELMGFSNKEAEAAISSLSWRCSDGLVYPKPIEESSSSGFASDAQLRELGDLSKFLMEFEAQ
eukprot:CAMPEP_0197527758 /NCGR_PEP_ID=MMETSP1318-20131121/22707_1 /TAXON_ID=552666 /ORGANISM="Partenskyella glossopodia, Strain RCC365" /LENGTH=207 /DNA_ID=CAMNT_0043082547 /DNA_START=56 /DNA_END=679 /DNA_ORIENTATION=-